MPFLNIFNIIKKKTMFRFLVSILLYFQKINLVKIIGNCIFLKLNLNAYENIFSQYNL
jgi:hypothetical protein